MRSLRWIAVLAVSLLPLSSFADSLSLNNITTSDFDKIVKELSGNFAYSTVTPASSLGGLWGFEFGVVGGVTKTPEILSIVKRSSSTFNESKFPHGGALLRVGAPLGLTAELMAFPKMTISDLSISQYSGAAMWTITDVFFSDLPVTLATKGFYSTTSLSFSQTLSAYANIPATIDFDQDIYGAQFLVSKKFLVFEPYLGVGYARSKGDISLTSSNPLATIFTGGVSKATSKHNSMQWMGGLDIRLLFLSLGAEYQRSFGTSSYTGRLSFRF